MIPPRLVTISFSHFCEKARWALDRAGIAYDEEGHAPIAHLAFTRPRGGRSTPLLVRPGQPPLTDSTDILRWAEATRPGTLFPADGAARAEVEALEDRFDRELGPHTRRIAYHHLFSGGESIAPLIRATTTGLERAAAPLLARVAPPLIGRALRVDAAGAARSEERLGAVLADVETRLADGRRYFVGDRFTAADLTFAALLAPLLMPDQQPVTSKVPAPRALATRIEAMRARPAGAFALRLYATER